MKAARDIDNRVEVKIVEKERKMVTGIHGGHGCGTCLCGLLTVCAY